MRKIFVLTLAIFILLSFGLTGCSEEDPPPQSMTFVDDPHDTTKEFTIFENLKFKVKFVANSEFLEMFSFMDIGDSVTGKVKETKNKWKDDVIEGKAQQMKSNNEDLTVILNELGSMDFKIEYMKQNDTIVAIKVEFPGEGELDKISNDLMGGTYTIK